MIFLDYQISTLVTKLKQQIQTFITHTQVGSEQVMKEKNILKDNLEELLAILKNLNFPRDRIIVSCGWHVQLQI